MEITVNGEKKEYLGPASLTSLLAFLGISNRPAMVERNLRIVPRHEIEREPVADGDTIEIIRFVGGG